jgi:hypothetical protein
MAKKDDTPKAFNFTETEINVLKNFASINPSMVFEGTGFKVINNSKSVIGLYPFAKSYDFPTFGIYECSEFLTALGAMDKPQIEVEAKQITIVDGTNRLTYYTTATDLLPVVPDVGSKFSKLDCELEFTITADKLAYLLKMATILKSKYLFFESDKKCIRITAGDELATSQNNFEALIEGGITANRLTAPVKIILADFKILPGEYAVKLSPKISKWSNLTGIDYFVGTSA